jgi:prevent-host-death family protein
MTRERLWKYRGTANLAAYLTANIAASGILIAPKKVLGRRRLMLDITKDIQSLTTFRRRSGDFMKLLKRSKRPVVLTVKGKAAAVVQDAAAYQRLLNVAARADANEGIRQGLEDSKKGKTRPARDFFDEFENRLGVRS